MGFWLVYLDNEVILYSLHFQIYFCTDVANSPQLIGFHILVIKKLMGVGWTNQLAEREQQPIIGCCSAC